MKREARINRQRLRRQFRVRNRLKRVSSRPRLSVFRSLKHIYAQIIDDQTARTLVAASTLEKEIRGDRIHGGDIPAAQKVGKVIAERALAAGITKVVFDRGRYKYHGRMAALVDAARDAGLDIGPKKQIEAPAEEPAAVAPAQGKKASSQPATGGKKSGKAAAKPG